MRFSRWPFRRLGFWLTLTGLLAACVWPSTPPWLAPTTAATAAPTAPPTPTPTPTPTPAPPTTLRVWLPETVRADVAPQAYDLLLQRLQAFATAHDLRLEVRVKPLQGPSSILATLQAAREVAPQLVPDVVLLPHGQLAAAAQQALIFPLPEDAFTTPLSDPDWYPYAQHLAMVQRVVYGVPFGADALGLVYHPQTVPTPPTTWKDWLQQPLPWLLPLGDPNGAVLLALYRTAGGHWADENGRPLLEEAPLQQVLTFLQQAQQKERFDDTVLALTSDHMLWARYPAETQAFLLTRFAHLLPGPDPRRIAALPAPTGGQPVALAYGLLWALATPNARRQPLAVALLADLSDAAFVAQWTEAMGYLPPRQGVLDAWQQAQHRDLAKPLLPALQGAPPDEIVEKVGPVLQQAAAQVLKGAQSPGAAAHEAAAAFPTAQP